MPLLPGRIQALSVSVVLGLWSFLCLATPTGFDHAETKPVVVLLHGLARTASSMNRMEESLQAAGYSVCNISYPSRKHSIADLASDFVEPAIADCAGETNQPINFVTHSLGGIIVRELARKGSVPIGRVVMLGPPNHGSEVVDNIGDWRLFEALNGPAGRELGTGPGSTPLALGPVTFEAGVIAGKRSINWINSVMIPGTDDGKVSVESAKVEGMKDFIVLPATHTFLMHDGEAIDQTVHFLSTGCFVHSEERAGLCKAPQQEPAASH